jgi:type II secretory pathway pseudopilin PulG
MRPGEGHRGVRERGFTYIGLLVLVMLIGFMLAAAGEVASTTAQRERETELLFIGHQYRDSIARFVAKNHRFPQDLNELLGAAADSPVPVHFIRRLYPDPMTRAVDWTLLPAPGGGVMGVASSSTGTPLKHAGFDDVDTGFADAETYMGWAFVFNPNARFLRTPAPASPSAPRGIRPR